MFYNIKEFSVLINVSKQTLRNWDKEGKLTPIKLASGHRRYNAFAFEGLLIDRDVNSTVNFLIKSGLCLSQDSKLNLLLNPMSELIV